MCVPVCRLFVPFLFITPCLTTPLAAPPRPPVRCMMVPPPRAQVAGVSARGGCGLLPRLPPAACAPGVPLGVHGGV